MPREAVNTVAANDLAIEKRLKLGKDGLPLETGEWKVVGVPGLSLVMKPTGVATYFVRFMAGKGARRKQVRQALGRANGPTAIKLSKAKDQAINIARDGASRFDNDGAPTTTLRQLFDQFAENDRDRAPRTMNDYREALERDVFKSLGDVPVAEITAKDIARLLTKVESRSRNAAHKCRAALGSLYKWAKKRFHVDENIMLGISFTHKNEPRDRKIADDELAALWRAIESEQFGATQAMRLILKIAILTGQRNSEVAGARVAELHIDPSVANPYWQIPAERMKRKDGSDQYVFLSRQARDLFAEAVALAGSSEFVFPATTHGRHVEGVEREHITQESVSRAMARAAQLAKVKNVHLHDMRKALTSWLGDRGERSDVLDRILHHHVGHNSNQRGSVTESHYNFAIMATPLRDAWQRWADHVYSVAGQGAAGSNVVQLKENVTA
jgi:integrase